MEQTPAFTVKYIADNPESAFIIQRPRSVMTTYCMTRKNITQAAKHSNSIGTSLQGVYFLVGRNKIYAGKTEQGITRIKQHVYTKKWWDRAIMFLASPIHFSNNFISELESYVIKDLMDNSPYLTANETLPCYHGENQGVEETYKEMRLILNFLGVKTRKSGTDESEDEITDFSSEPSSPKKIKTEDDWASRLGREIKEVLSSVATEDCEWKWMTVTEFKNSHEELAEEVVNQIGTVLRRLGFTYKKKKMRGTVCTAYWLPAPPSFSNGFPS